MKLLVFLLIKPARSSVFRLTANKFERPRSINKINTSCHHFILPCKSNCPSSTFNRVGR